MHAAECQVADCLARMAATPAQHIEGGQQRVTKWLSRLCHEQGEWLNLPLAVGWV